MGQVIKIGEEYYIEFDARGLLYQKKAGVDKAAAEKLLQETEAEIEKGEQLTEIHEIEIDAFLKQYIEHAQTKFSPQSLEHFKDAIAHFESFCKNKLDAPWILTKVTPSVIEDYRSLLLDESKQKENSSSKDVNFQLLLIREVLDFAISAGCLNDNPTLHAQFLPDESTTALPALNNLQLMKMLQSAPKEDVPLFVILFNTGLSITECLQLGWANVDFKEEKLNLEGRCIPLEAHTVVVLENLIKNVTDVTSPVLTSSDGSPLSQEIVIQKFSKLLTNNAISLEVNSDLIRNTFAKKLLDKNVKLFDVSQNMGFTDIAESMVYFPFMKQNLFS